MKTLLATSLVSIPTVLACAPGGNINKINYNDCPVILDMDFSSTASSPYTSNVNITQGTVHSSLQNPYNGITSNGVFASSGSQETISFNFTVNAGTTLDLEGIQLLGYWTTELSASNAWDRFDISLTVDGSLVADSYNFIGYKGKQAPGAANSNSYWEFAGPSINTDTNSTYTVNGGQLVSIAIRDRGSSVPPSSGSNVIAIDGIQIHGCAVPEPSSAILISLGVTGLLARRKR